MNQMDISQWNFLGNNVVKQMLEHVKHFATPISKVIADDYGEHLGSGSFVEIEGSKYLITNEHVGKKVQFTPLAHQFFNSDSVVRLTTAIVTQNYPVDVALTKIEERAWNICNHDAQAIPAHRFATEHQPVMGELLFLIGYSGERAAFYFGSLISPGTPYLTQEIEFPEDIGDSNFHFAIHYKPDLATSVDGSYRGLPKPPGMSGSLVWNTRFVEHYQAGKSWIPEDAQVSGIIWGWPSSAACLLATKVEHLNIDDLCSAVNNIA